MRSGLLALSALLVLTPAAAFAQIPLPVGGEIFVASDLQIDPSQVAVDVNSSGAFVVVWHKAGGGGVKARQFSSAGVGGAEISVNSDATTFAVADVATTDNGEFAVVWSGSDPDSAPTTNVKVFDASGSPTLGPLTFGTGYPIDAAISMNRSNGDFVVAWIEGYYGFVGKYDNTGTLIGGVTNFAYAPASVEVAMDTTGNFVVAWGTETSGVYGSTFDAAGTQVNDLFTVNAGEGYDPSVAPVGAGNFVVAWAEYAAPCADNISAKIVDATGVDVVGEFTVDQQASGALSTPSVAGNAAGFVVAWDAFEDCFYKQLPTPEQDGSVTAIVGRYFDASGSPLSSEFIVNTLTNGRQSEPAVGMNSAGEFVVGWANSGVTPDEAKAQKFITVLPELSVDDVTVTEGNAGTVNATFTVTLTPPINATVTVDYQTADVSANAGSDYTAIPLTTLTFNPMEPSKTVTVVVSGDTTAELNETFQLLLSNPSNATISDGQGVGAITNDDAVTISISDVSVLEGDAGSTNATFFVTLSSPSASNVTVDFATASGTATAGSDFTTISLTTLTFVPPETSKPVVVSVTGDTDEEPNEFFFVNLSNASGGTIADSQGKGGITNDDSPPCGSGKATNLAPAGGASVTSPVTFSWTGVAAAHFYEVYASVNGGAAQLVGLTTATTLTKPLGSGAIQWYVVTQFGSGCLTSKSQSAGFTVSAPPPPPPPPPPPCNSPGIPLPSVVAESTTGEFYELTWTAVSGAGSYEVQESLSESFAGAATLTVSGLSMTFRHPGIETPTAYFYRVRGIADCDSTSFGAYSKVIRVVNLPKPAPSTTNPQIVTEIGNDDLVSTLLFIPGFTSSGKRTPFAASFTVSSNEEWLIPTPPTGELPPAGATVELVADPTKLELGAATATVTITRNDGLARTTHGTTTSSVPVSVSLVSPITPLGKETTPPPNALIIPAVANIGGFDAKWLSDVRISNTADATIQYQLTFTSTETDGTIDGKKTSYTIRPGQTVAMDDVVRQWFGFGDLSDGTNGTLEIRPLNFAGRAATPEAALAATVATSRTYTRDANSLASFGQFMPSVAFADFMNGTLAGARLSMQQVSQSQSTRTNFGLVEGAGQAVDVLLTVYDRLGVKLGQIPVSLLAGEHRQLNSLLALNGITVIDGRLEATILGGAGAIMAYASVVSSGTGDPTLVLGVDPGKISASKYVLAGIADLVNGDANWRSDVRIFNGGATAQEAQLFFYQQGSTTAVGPVPVTIAPSEVKVLEGVVRSQFGLENTGGAMHIVTSADSSLIITGETFDVNESGRFGQTIPGVTLAEAVGIADRALQILQLEDSAQFRTNLGMAEVSGKPVTVQLQLIIPLSLSAPVMTVQLGANEFTQINGIIRTLARRDVYNARIAVKVIAGEGSVVAYGSVVDNTTLDATYVPGQ